MSVPFRSVPSDDPQRTAPRLSPAPLPAARGDIARWARDAERATAATAAARAEAAVASAREEAQRERQAWESLRTALEASAAAREREAREAAEETAREVIEYYLVVVVVGEVGLYL